MESSRYIIWIKRFLPVVILVAAWVGWGKYEQYYLAQEIAEDKQMAAATAYLYVGAVKYRQDSLGFIAYRDSLLESMDISAELLKLYASEGEIEPYRYKRYVKTLGQLTDSLYRVEDSLRKISDSLARDTVGDVTVED